MKYNDLYNLFYNVYDYLYRSKSEYYPFYEYIKTIHHTQLEDKTAQLLIQNWRIKELLNGMKFNNIHIPANDKIFQNVLKCLEQREKFNKTYFVSTSALHVYYDPEKFNFDEFKKLEQFSFDKKYFYTVDYDFVGELKLYLQMMKYEIVHIVKPTDRAVNEKTHIYIALGMNDSLADLEECIISHANIRTKKIYISTQNKKKGFLQKYFDIIKKYSEEYNIPIMDVNFLIGEHIGVDNNDTLYMKTNKKNIYQSEDKTFLDWFVEHMFLNKHCLNCDNDLLCATNTLDDFCEWKFR